MSENNSEAKPLALGDTFHAIRTGMSIRKSHAWGDSQTAIKGDNFTLTAEMVEATADRFGNSWTSVIHDPEEQERRWGAIHFVPGPAPADTETWEPGSAEWERDREDARRAAFAIPYGRARLEALREVVRRFGDGPSTSTSVDRPEGWTDPGERANAEAERKNIETRGVYAARSTSREEK